MVQSSERPATPKRSLLLIAYYFPPLGMSGVQRNASLSRYLAEDGWEVTILTAKPSAYFAFDQGLLETVEKAGVRIERTSSIDPTRVFGRKTVPLSGADPSGFLNRLSQTVFQPDNKIGWLPFAVARGRRLFRQQRFDAIISSAPPYTSHLIGALLSKENGVPLILDYRDDWISNPRHTYPTQMHRDLAARMERFALSRSHHVTVINKHIRQKVLERATGLLGPNNVSVISHGYDDELEQRAADVGDTETKAVAQTGPPTVTFVYTGVFYDVQRPDTFLRGLSIALTDDPSLRQTVRAQFIGLLPGYVMTLVSDLNLDGIVSHEGYRAHEESIRHLFDADVLWMTIGKAQGAEGISTGKLYEYFGTRKPVLGLVPEGVAAEDIRRYGSGVVVDPDDTAGAAVAIRTLAKSVLSRDPSDVNEAFVRSLNRKRLAGQMADLIPALGTTPGSDPIPAAI